MTGRNSSASSVASPNPVRVRFDIFELDEANARLLRDGKAVALAPTPFAVLCTLVRQQGSLLTKNVLLDEVWGHQFVSDSVLKTAISDVRTVLDDDPRQPRFIETVSRRGYRFIAPTIAATALAKGSEHPNLQAQSFVGRAEALRRLSGAWARACDGQHVVVWVAGEPGVGKTTLIDHFTAGLGDIAHARGQCVEHHGPGEPYLPVLEALAQLCRSDDAVAQLLRAVAPTWLLQLPWLSTADERDALRRELAGVGPDRMLREMGELLDRYTERRPLLLVTEDLHWSDRATIQLIDYIARRRGNARLVWLSSFRLAEVVALEHPLNSVRHELRSHGLCEEIILDAFSEREVGEYVAAHSPPLAGDEAFARTLHERTDGVPLFVVSLLADVIMRTSSDAEGDAQARVANVAVPQNLTAIIDHYIARLGNEERALLSAAAVCGVEFRVSTIADVVESDAASVAQMCDQLVREQLWLTAARTRDASVTGELPYAFRHALFRQVLYERTPPSVRAQLHRKVGVALERERAAGMPVAATELALHFERGREPTTAARCYAEAAESALLRFTPSHTITLTERGMALLPAIQTGSERTILEMTLATLQGTAAVQVLGPGSIEAARAYQRAQSLLDDAPLHPLRGLFLHGLGLILWMRGELDEANALAARCEALSAAAADHTALFCACLIHGMVEHARGRPRLARQWLEKCIDEANGLDESTSRVLFAADPTVLALGLLAINLLHLGFVKQGRARLNEAHTRARALRQPGPQLAALWFESRFEVRMGNAERVADVSQQLLTLVEQHELWPQGRAAHLWFRGWAQAQLGEPRAGYHLIKDGYEKAVGMGIRMWASETLGYAVEALAHAGDWSGARRELEEAMRCAEAVHERLYLPQLLLLDSRIADALADSNRAMDSMRQALAEARSQEAPWLELLALSELCGRNDATAEDRRALAALVDRLPEASDTKAVKNARALVSKRLVRNQRATVS
jgi:DNA-binding winged helix-turn-helix (wHTH) protein